MQLTVKLCTFSFCVLLLIQNYCNGISLEESVLQKQTFESMDEWLNEINNQLREVNQLTAFFAWELSVNPSNELSDQSIEFNSLKSMWITMRCTEIDELLNNFNVNETIERMIHLLCRGPRFNSVQSSKLSEILYRMQTIFTETEICLPQNFDICTNLDRIFEFTYIKHSNGQINRLHMSYVAPIMSKRTIKSRLNYFTENSTFEDSLFLTNTDKSNVASLGEIETEMRIRIGPFQCVTSEIDIDKLMSGNFSPFNRPDCTLRFNEIFRWTWESWRLAVGTAIGRIYPDAINLMNIGAQNNGYHDIGKVWQEEVEIPELRTVAVELLNNVMPFYELLHGTLRNVIWNKMKSFENFQLNGTIPAHLLGSMWSQNWEIYHKLLIPFNEVDLNENIKAKNWNSVDMVKRADDFYSSLGLPKMTNTFWQKSIFRRSDPDQKCHGTAANMFQPNDFRMIVCTEQTFDDFYVIIHEMGHIQYYMAFEEQPIIFQDANSAMQESIGDAIFLGVMTPQHLNRLQLLPDKYLLDQNLPKFDQNYLRMIFSNDNWNKNEQHNRKNKLLNKSGIVQFESIMSHLANNYPNITEQNQKLKSYLKYKEKIDESINAFDLSFLLKMALMKIPQIPFEYILDVLRWDMFDGNITMSNGNSYFWQLITNYQGIHAPDHLDRKHFFDAGAKFHVADNTPFIRYYLASFLNVQIFRGLCEVTVFGKVNPAEPLPMPLHRCDIYGSKRAGKLIKKALRMGASTPWQDVLFILTGSRKISAEALLQYYSPLIKWLEKLAIEFNISIGW